jgi:hypothetical protein
MCGKICPLTRYSSRNILIHIGERKANISTKKTTSGSLFPILPSGSVGIARLAAEARHTDDGHLIEFKAIESRSLLNRNLSQRTSWIEYSINPYWGCIRRTDAGRNWLVTHGYGVTESASLTW